MSRINLIFPILTAGYTADQDHQRGVMESGEYRARAIATDVTTLPESRAFDPCRITSELRSSMSAAHSASSSSGHRSTACGIDKCGLSARVRSQQSDAHEQTVE